MSWELHTGDCAAVMREQIADGAIDLTVTSPPYDNLRKYNGYHFDFEAIAAELWRVTKPGGVVVWVVADATINGSETGTSFRQALYFMGLGFNLHDTMIYNSHKPPISGPRYQQAFEYMLVFSKDKIKTVNLIKEECIKYGKKTTRQTGQRSIEGSFRQRHSGQKETKRYKPKGNIWYFYAGYRADDKEYYGHPARFPEALARDHIISWSNPGDVVLDPMCGSGTTGKQAVLLGRRFIGIDISAEYVEGIARPRIEKAAEQAQQLELL
jgi:DNA modification methylase